MRTLKQFKEHILETNSVYKHVKEDGMGGGAMGAGPTNVVGQGAIAGTGGKGGEPGVSKKRKPVMSLFKRKQPKNM